MKSSIKFSVVFVVFASLFLSCSLFLSDASAQSALEKADIGDNTIRIQTPTHTPVIDIQLLENTDHCFTECHAILRLHPYQDIVLPSGPDADFAWNFEKARPWMDGLVSYHFELLETAAYEVEMPDYETTTVNSTCYDDQNQSYQCEADQTIQTGSHQETRYRDEYSPFAFWGETLAAGEDYTIKLVGRKAAKLGTNNVDWIPTIKGLELDEWEWWNTTFLKCRELTNSTVTYTPAGYQAKITFGNSTIPFADFMPGAQDVRFTNGTDCNLDGGAALDAWNESSDTGNITGNLTFWIELDAANKTTFLMYYNATGVGNYFSGSSTFLDFDDFEYADSPANHGWTITNTGSTSVSTSTTYAKSGSRSVALVDTNDGWAYVTRTTPVTGIAEIWLRDVTGQGGYELQIFRQDNYGGGAQRLVGLSELDVLNNYSSCATYASAYMDTKVPRTSGWRKFSIEWNGTNYIIKIDESFTNVSASEAAPNTIAFGSWWGASSASTLYWDAFLVRKNATSVPSWSIGGEERPCPTDDTYINQNTKFEQAGKFCNIPDYGVEGVLIINASNITLDCNGMTLNGSGAQMGGAGIANKPFNILRNVTIKNCIIENYGRGIQYANPSSVAEYNEIYNNTLAFNDKGLYLYNGIMKNVVAGNNMSNNNYGIYIDNFIGEDVGSNSTFLNNTIKSNANYDVQVYANDYTFFINDTYDTEYVSAANLTRQWYVRANVTDKNMAPIQNAQVTAKDIYNNQEWTENTSSGGLTGWNIVIQYIHNGSGIYYSTPHNISGLHAGYPSNYTIQNVTQSIVVSLPLKYPLITFNVTSGEDGASLDNVNIACNYSGFGQGGDTTNTYGPYEFLPESDSIVWMFGHCYHIHLNILDSFSPA